MLVFSDVLKSVYNKNMRTCGIDAENSSLLAKSKSPLFSPSLVKRL